MLVEKFSLEKLEQAYGIGCQRLYPVAGAAATPFGALRGIVKPGQKTVRHNHHEQESFVILSGQAEVVVVGHGTVQLGKGDTIFLPAFEDHTIANVGDGEDLEFLAIWWEDLTELPGASSSAREDTLVTATPPTPNGDLHLGHLSGPFVGADIYARFARQRGSLALYLTGSDENQSYVPLKARQVKAAPLELAQQNAKAIRQTLQQAHIDYQVFYEPSQLPQYDGLVRSFFQQLYRQGKLVEKEVDACYCATTGRYLHEAYISGTCPVCGAGSDGNACEQCGFTNDNTDLLDARSNLAGGGIVLRKSKRLYFPLQAYEAQLREYYHSVDIPAHLRAMCYQMIEQGLPDIAISHETDWGITLDLDGFDQQRIYVWAEMIVGYLYGLTGCQHHQPDALIAHWNQREEQLVQFFGFDNGFFHALLFPALLFAHGPEPKLADAFVVNEFLKLDNLKFSTSRNHLIWARDMLEQVPADYVRLYLGAIRPETEQTNFTREGFQHFVNGRFVATVQQWMEQFEQMVAAYSSQVLPAPGAWSSEHKAFYAYLRQQHQVVEQGYDASSFSTQQVIRAVFAVMEEAIRSGRADRHLVHSGLLHDQYRTSLALQGAALKSVVCMLAPVMPVFSQRMAELLAFEVNWQAEPAFLDAGLRPRAKDFAFLQPINVV